MSEVEEARQGMATPDFGLIFEIVVLIKGATEFDNVVTRQGKA